MLLLTLGLTVMSGVLMAYMSGDCNKAPSATEIVRVEQKEEPLPLSIFVSVASYRDSECKTTMQV